VCVGGGEGGRVGGLLDVLGRVHVRVSETEHMARLVGDGRLGRGWEWKGWVEWVGRLVVGEWGQGWGEEGWTGVKGGCWGSKAVQEEVGDASGAMVAGGGVVGAGVEEGVSGWGWS
jgi:hypothetical protein